MKFNSGANKFNMIARWTAFSLSLNLSIISNSSQAKETISLLHSSQHLCCQLVGARWIRLYEIEEEKLIKVDKIDEWRWKWKQVETLTSIHQLIVPQYQQAVIPGICCIMCGHFIVEVCPNCWINLSFLITFSNYLLQLAQCRHGINCNPFLSFPLRSPGCIWSTSSWWWPDKQKVEEVESRRGGEEDWRSTTKIAFRLSGRSRMSGRESTGCELFRREECHSQWIDLSSLGIVATSWAWTHWSGRAQPLQESKWRSWRSLVLHHRPSQDVGTLHCF